MNKTIAVVGLGYVGLPLATSFAKHFSVIGYDVNTQRINDLSKGIDKTSSVSSEEILNNNLSFTTIHKHIADANIYIITVPTPIDEACIPDLRSLKAATKTIAKHVNEGDLIILESTVYPGVTEEICVPIIEKESGLKLNKGFHIGYSPERVSPGKGARKLEEIVKIVSGSSERALSEIYELYSLIIDAGVYKAPNIKTAEAAKVIENTQRDLNIALVNELAIIFERLGIETNEVIKAAGTKWNFVKYQPGLVGGHCIGVDPYYLTYKAKCVGYDSKVITAGREVNDSMGINVAQRVIKALIQKNHSIKNSIVTVFGVTFKENIPDIRNTKVIDIVRELQSYGVCVQVTDPYACPMETYEVYGVELTSFEKLLPSNACVIAVGHDEYKSLSLDSLKNTMTSEPVFFDVKGMFVKEEVESYGFRHMQL